MDGLLAIAPAAFLAVGALIASPPAARFGARRAAATLSAAALSAASAAFLLWRLVAIGGANVQLTLSPWSRSVFLDAPLLSVDPLAAACLCALGLLAVFAAARALVDERPEAAMPPLAVVAVAAVFVAGARIPLGLVVGWMLLDLALFFVARGGRNGLLIGQIGLLCALAGLAALPAEAGTLAGARTLPEGARILVLGAAVIRAGLFPLWWAVPRSQDAVPWQGLGVQIAPTLAGLFLALELAGARPAGVGLDTAMLVAALVAMAGGAYLAFTAGSRVGVLHWRVTVQAGWVLTALAMGDPVSRAIGVLLALDLVIAAGLRFAAEGIGDRGQARAARVAGEAAMLGIPPLLGFAARMLLYVQVLARAASLAGRSAFPSAGLDQRGLGYLALAVLFVGSVFALAPMPRELPVARTAIRGRRAFAVALLFVAAASCVLGVTVGRWSVVFEAVAGAALLDPLLLLRAPFSSGTLVWLAPLLILGAPVLGWGIRRLGLRAGGSGRRRARARELLLLTGAFEGAQQLLLRGGAVVQLRGGLVDGRRSIAITVLGGLAVGGVMLSGVPGAPPPNGGAAAAVLVVVAAVLVAILLLHGAPAAKLGALVVAYGVAAWMLWAAQVPAVVSLIKLLVGWLVVGMLAISVLQAPIDRRLVAAARRLREIEGPARSGSDRIIPLLSLAVVVVAAFGIWVHVAPPGEGLPPAVVEPAIVLFGGGVLVLIFAASALELACGVLLSLLGAEVAYALVDPGLVVTGGLAVFDMLFAILASFFVGLAAPPPRVREDDEEEGRPEEAARVRPEVRG